MESGHSRLNGFEVRGNDEIQACGGTLVGQLQLQENVMVRPKLEEG